MSYSHMTLADYEASRPGIAPKINPNSVHQPKQDQYQYAMPTPAAEPTLLETPPPARPKTRR